MKQGVFTFSILLLCSSALVIFLIFRYQPSIEALARTSEVRGTVHFSHSNTVVPEVDGQILMCSIDFLSWREPCHESVPELREGVYVTASVVTLPAASGNVHLTVAIRENGKVLYAIPPQRIIRDYIIRSWLFVLFFPFVFGVMMVIDNDKSPPTGNLERDLNSGSASVGAPIGSRDGVRPKPIPMKAWLAFSIAIIVGSYFGELHLVRTYMPTPETLKPTTTITGKLYFVSAGRQGGWTAEVNGIPLLCEVDYLAPGTNCNELVPILKNGTVVTVAMVYLPAALRNGYLTRAIFVNGEKIYSNVPDQVIADYIKSSRIDLRIAPILLISVLFPLTILFYLFNRSLLKKSVDDF